MSDFNTVAERSKFANHLGGALLPPPLGDGRPPFLIGHALVQDLPDEATEAMSNRADRYGMPEARDQSTVDEFEDAAFRFDRRLAA